MGICLSLDIGTSKLAALLYDSAKQSVLATVSAPNSATVAGLPAGHHEQNPALILETCKKLMRQALDSQPQARIALQAVSISGQMHGVLLVNHALQPQTNLMTWCDQRAAELTSSVNRNSWPVDTTGCYLHPGYGGATLAVLAQTGALHPGVKALTIADYVAASLCGLCADDAVTDPTHAASWGILDMTVGTWHSSLLESLEIPVEVLPKINPAMSVVGPLSAEVMNELGLPPSQTVRMRLPLGDNQASYVGACGLGKDNLLLNLGTGGQISVPVSAMTYRDSLETRPMPFGGFLLVGASLCGGRAYAHLKDFFKNLLAEFTGTTADDNDVYALMNRLAQKAADDTGAGATLHADTRFAGTRIDPAARGSIHQINMDNFTPGMLSLAFVRGMIRELTGMLTPDDVKGCARVLTSGNAIRKNPLAMQIITEELGLPCEAANDGEEAALGAAITAAHAEGWL